MKKIIVTFIVFSMVLFMFTGCGKESLEDAMQEMKQPAHVVLVLGSTSNTPQLNLSAVTKLLRRLFEVGNSTIHLVVADGQPFLYDQISITEIDSSYSDKKRNEIIEKHVTELNSIMKKAVAKSPHADYLGAIELASRILQGYEDEHEKILLIFGSCLSDVEPLDFSNTYLHNIDIEATVTNLQENNNLANLQGCMVTVFNCGDTVLPQETLSRKEREVLKALWKAILNASEAEEVKFNETPPSYLVYEGLPEVNVIPVVGEENSIKEDKNKEVKEEKELENKIESVIFTEQVMNFKPGTSELTNIDGAMEAIKTVAEYMRDNPEVTALLVGTTACASDEQSCIIRSYDRAFVVEELFKKEGITSERLQIIGTGYLSCFWKNDQKEDGRLDESIAPDNRSVIWIDRNSELAEFILNDTDASKFMIEE